MSEANPEIGIDQRSRQLEIERYLDSHALRDLVRRSRSSWDGGPVIVIESSYPDNKNVFRNTQVNLNLPFLRTVDELMGESLIIARRLPVSREKNPTHIISVPPDGVEFLDNSQLRLRLDDGVYIETDTHDPSLLVADDYLSIQERVSVGPGTVDPASVYFRAAYYSTFFLSRFDSDTTRSSVKSLARKMKIPLVDEERIAALKMLEGVLTAPSEEEIG